MAQYRLDIFAETMAESTPLPVEQIRRVINLHMIGYSTLEIGQKTAIEEHIIHRLTWIWDDVLREEMEEEENEEETESE
ncbi:MAG: hypothetical protein AB1599_02390 [Planctomycetota bacterium]